MCVCVHVCALQLACLTAVNEALDYNVQVRQQDTHHAHTLASI
jgi:hypothetical protein